MEKGALVDYVKSLDCIHCGLCLRTCPTYQLTGSEPSSPRGRIYLMRAVAEGRLAASDATYREELDFCLVCRHCESVCPAGVRFGEMMETARAGAQQAAPRGAFERFARWFGFQVVLPSRFWLSLSVGALRFAQRTGLLKLAASFAGPRKAALLSMSAAPPARERRLLPPTTPAHGAKRGEVAVLEGCVMPELFGRVNRATVATLSAIGFEARTAQGHVCCGALHAHNGELEGARDLARGTIEHFERLGESAIVVNSAGCGAHMKAYGTLLEDDPAWSERARRFAKRVVDFTEFVAAQAPSDWRPVAPDSLGKLAYDDPCHLCHGQQIRSQPRALLDRLQGAKRVEMDNAESCCGSAGIYSLLRPADSQAVFERKARAFADSGADVLVTANPGCQMQWESGLKRAGSKARVVHIAEVLAPPEVQPETRPETT
jgi:glycolate oxidase iron-sulfur subunit